VLHCTPLSAVVVAVHDDAVLLCLLATSLSGGNESNASFEVDHGELTKHLRTAAWNFLVSWT